MSDKNSPLRRKRYRYAVCGLGPAGCGFLLHAIKENAIDQLVEGGLVLIERSANPGPGKVGSYQLTGNSLSRAFLDCIDDPKLGWLFGGFAAAAPSVTRLREMEFAAPPLDIVGEFLSAVARRMITVLSRDYQVPVLLETSVDRIQRHIDGSFSLCLNGGRETLQVDNVLCGFGGRQADDMIRRTEVQPGLRLGDHVKRLIPSDDFLMMSDQAIRDAIPFRADFDGDVAIVGGSHSAMSTIDRLTDALGPVGLRRIIMLHRDPLRLYYASIGDAVRDGYAFDDPDDICPMSGRVNRFGGLRYRSFDIARSILTTGRTPDQLVEVVSVPLRDTGQERVTAHLGTSPAVVTCLGYQANLPPMVDHWNRPVALRNEARGIEIDDSGRALTVDDEPVPGLYVFGIGSRLLTRSAAIGGEPSFHGSADGIWLYHNHGGGVILNALRSTMPESTVETTWGEEHVRFVS